MSLDEMIYPQYVTVAGLGAMVELRLRLLASKTPELERYAHDQNLEELETRVFDFFSKYLSEADKAFLKDARGLRNKILHSDFKSSAKKTENITGTKSEALSVYAMKISTGETRPVSEMSKREGGVFGWLLECAQTGVFQQAAQVFKRADALYNYVSFEHALEVMDPKDAAEFRKTFPKKP